MTSSRSRWREPSAPARRTPHRSAVALLVAVVATLAFPVSVGAVIGGEPTGADRYSNVGLLSLPGAFCSGTLVSPTVFLTAAHCVVSDGQGARAIVTFDPTVSFDANDEVVGPSVAGTAYYDSRFDDPPRHGGTRGFIDQTAFDLAVVVLDRPASDVFPGITPAVLPTLDRLDAYARSAKAKDFGRVHVRRLRRDPGCARESAQRRLRRRPPAGDRPTLPARSSGPMDTGQPQRGLGRREHLQR